MRFAEVIQKNDFIAFAAALTGAVSGSLFRQVGLEKSSIMLRTHNFSFCICMFFFSNKSTERLDVHAHISDVRLIHIDLL